MCVLKVKYIFHKIRWFIQAVQLLSHANLLWIIYLLLQSWVSFVNQVDLMVINWEGLWLLLYILHSSIHCPCYETEQNVRQVVFSRPCSWKCKQWEPEVTAFSRNVVALVFGNCKQKVFVSIHLFYSETFNDVLAAQ